MVIGLVRFCNLFNDVFFVCFVCLRIEVSILAPPGCLQYYPDPNGIFESFNYNNGLGPYIGDMNYAICFKKSTSTQQIK